MSSNKYIIDLSKESVDLTRINDLQSIYPHKNVPLIAMNTSVHSNAIPQNTTIANSDNLNIADTSINTNQFISELPVLNAPSIGSSDQLPAAFNPSTNNIDSTLYFLDKQKKNKIYVHPRAVSSTAAFQPTTTDSKLIEQMRASAIALAAKPRTKEEKIAQVQIAKNNYEQARSAFEQRQLNGTGEFETNGIPEKNINPAIDVQTNNFATPAFNAAAPQIDNVPFQAYAPVAPASNAINSSNNLPRNVIHDIDADLGTSDTLKHDTVDLNNLLIQQYKPTPDQINAPNVAVNLDLERRIRMEASRKNPNANRLPENYVSFRDRIFSETIRIVASDLTVLNTQRVNPNFASNFAQQQRQSIIKQAYLDSLKSNNTQFANSSQNTNLQFTPNEPVFVYNGNISGSQAANVQQSPVQQVVSNESTKTSIQTNDFATSAKPFEQPSQTVTTNETSEINTEIPVLITNLSEKQIVENFVSNYNNQFPLNERVSSDQTVSVSLNQDFYAENDQRTTKGFDTETPSLVVADETKKFTREDANTSTSHSLVSLNETNASEQTTEENTDSLEQLLRSLTAEIKAVTSDPTYNNNQKSSNKNQKYTNQRKPQMQNKQNVNVNATQNANKFNVPQPVFIQPLQQNQTSHAQPNLPQFSQPIFNMNHAQQDSFNNAAKPQQAYQNNHFTQPTNTDSSFAKTKPTTNYFLKPDVVNVADQLPVQEQVQKFAQEQVQQPVKKVIQESIQKFVQESTQQPVQKNIQEAVQEAVQSIPFSSNVKPLANDLNSDAHEHIDQTAQQQINETKQTTNHNNFFNNVPQREKVHSVPQFKQPLKSETPVQHAQPFQQETPVQKTNLQNVPKFEMKPISKPVTNPTPQPAEKTNPGFGNQWNVDMRDSNESVTYKPRSDMSNPFGANTVAREPLQKAKDDSVMSLKNALKRPSNKFPTGFNSGK